MSSSRREDLQDLIAKRQAIVIVGAGVSMGATGGEQAASWIGLLKHGVKHCMEYVPGLHQKWNDIVTYEIESQDLDDLLSAATKISRKLGAPTGGEYRSWLRKSVGSLKVTHQEVLEALVKLRVPLATTNYDGLLEEVSGWPTVTWRDGAIVERVIRGDDSGIIHLHGFWKDPESVILGIRSYEDVMRNEHAQTMLRALLAMKSFVFIGCGAGLQDSNFGALLRWSRSVFGISEYRHYRLVRESEVEEVQKQHPINEERIFALSYGPDHTDLADFLRELRPSKSTAPPPPPENVSQEYLINEIINKTDRIDIKGIYSKSGAEREAIYFPIEELYTPLTTHQALREESIGRNIAPRGEDAQVPLTELLSKHRRLLIIGEPGGGKTTFLRLIACVLARDCLETANLEYEPKRLRYLGLAIDALPPVPVFIRLSTLTKHLEEQRGDHGDYRTILHFLKEHYDTQTCLTLQTMLKGGQCALLLDGLDEVADSALRERLAEVVDSALKKWPENLIVISSRPYGYEAVAALQDVNKAHIDAFGEYEIREFLRRWVRALPDDDQREEEYLGEIKRGIIDVGPIRRLARNPVMLTCLCVVHWNERKLPEGKADLVGAVLRWLLNAREVQRLSCGYTNTFAEECFKALAFTMTMDTKGKMAAADLAWSSEQLAIPYRNEYGIEELTRVRCEGMKFLEAELLHSGIVVQAGLGQVRFWHLTFQEHYAARVLVERSDEEWWKAIESHLCDRQWSEVLDHLAGCLAWTGRYRLNVLVERILKTASADNLAATATAVGVLGRLLQILKVYDKYHPPKHLGWEAAQEQAMAIFTLEGSAQVPVTERIVAAEALGQAGDPRLADPMKNMLPVPEQSNLLLGKYPVTVEEYRRFVNNDGYKQRDLWGEAWQLKQKNKWIEPEDWKEQLETPNRPVVGVSWYEATAYCCWLSARYSMSGQVFRLPTEAEWEAAARHPEGDYPWGKDKPHEELTNFGHKVGQPTPVGIYPGGAGRGGHLDLAGNVWEWCQDYRSADVEKGADRRALRGGCFWDVAQGLRASSRGWNRLRAEDRHVLCGFRVALAPPSL